MYWFTARYDGDCATKDCTNAIKQGDKILMNNGQAFCEECGKELEEDD